MINSTNPTRIFISVFLRLKKTTEAVKLALICQRSLPTVACSGLADGRGGFPNGSRCPRGVNPNKE